jgi:alkylated DNA nucleotide flippase Atl1
LHPAASCGWEVKGDYQDTHGRSLRLGIVGSVQLPAGFRVVSELTALDAAVHERVRAIPPGRVSSYGRIADELGLPGRSRRVGLAMTRGDDDVPWHRVVNASGRLVPHHEREQAQRLRAEGVMVKDGRVTPPIPWNERGE